MNICIYLYFLSILSTTAINICEPFFRSGYVHMVIPSGRLGEEFWTMAHYSGITMLLSTTAAPCDVPISNKQGGSFLQVLPDAIVLNWEHSSGSKLAPPPNCLLTKHPVSVTLAVALTWRKTALKSPHSVKPSPWRRIW